MDMESLKTLVLSGCLKLQKFPEIVKSMECLSELYLDRTPIKELPLPVESLKGIVLLSMEDCKNLVSLPCNINGFNSLKTLKLSGCCQLENLPDYLGQVDSLEKLDVSGTAIRQPVPSIFMLKNLKELSFHGCKGPVPSSSQYMHFPFSLMSRRSLDPMALVLPSFSGLKSLTKLDLSDCDLGEGAICNEIGSLVSLKNLYLVNNNFVSLPASISRLSQLLALTLSGCKRLQLLPELPSNLVLVEVNNCTSLETLSNALKSCQPFDISCVNCLNLFDYNSVAFSMMKEKPNSKDRVTSIIFPGTKIPKWFSHQSEDSSIRVKRHLHSEVKGFFVCAALSALGHLCTSNYCCALQCFTEFIDFIHKDPFTSSNALSDHLWLIYIPFGRILFEPQNHWYQFDFDTSRCAAMHVRRCAAHLIYEQEVDKFDHSTDKCRGSVSGNLIEFHQSLVAKSEMDIAHNKAKPAETRGIGKNNPELS